MRYEIAIIIINYNSSAHTMNCIESILDKTDKDLSYQIIVVDNASKNEDYSILKSFITQLGKKDNLTLHRSRINTGFGGGNMFGVQFANAEYYAFVNNDTIMINDCISICYQFLKNHENACCCGPQIYNENNKKTVSFDHFTSLGREIFGKKALETLFPSKKPNRRKTYTSPIKVDYVNGSFIFFRASDFNNIGGFDTNIFLYFEESDVCYRLKKKNKDTYFLPNAEYIHYQGKSTKKNIRMKIELKTSMFYVFRKNYGYLVYQILRLVFIIRYGFTSIIKPRYFPLLLGIILGLPLSKSLKQKQVIVD